MVRLQEDDFDISQEVRTLTRDRTDVGAVVTFTGLVRDLAGDQKISSMTLEHYPAMAQKQLDDIEAEARRRWQLLDSLIIHRYGDLNPGDQIVLVVTLSAHREDAFLAAQFLMDWLKTKAPFWKKEATQSGKQWVAAKADDDEAAARWVKNNLSFVCGLVNNRLREGD